MTTPPHLTEDWLTGPHGPIRCWASTRHHGLPVLFIHGYGAMIDYWGAALHTAAQTHTVYAYDLYGFGYSAPLHHAPHPQLWVRQAALLLEHMPSTPVVVVGHSLGAFVAASLARCLPHRVRGLVLVDGAGVRAMRRLYAPAEQLFYQMVRTPLLGETMAHMLGDTVAVRRFLDFFYHRKERLRPELITLLAGPLRRPGTSLFWLEVLRHYERYSLDLLPGEVRAPTLIIWGRNDRALPATLAHTIQRTMLPQATVALVDESGHCPFDETPEAFCTILDTWLAELAAS